MFGGAWLATRWTRAELNPDLSWVDVTAVGTLSGVGFTVSLLIAELAFAGGAVDTAKFAVLVGSSGAAVIAGLLLLRRDRHYRRLDDADAGRS